MRSPKKLRFSRNSLQPVGAPASVQSALPWLNVSASIHQVHREFIAASFSLVPPEPYQQVPPGTKVYIFRPGREKIFIGTTV